ncbi:sensor histidine kinase [Yinghuangia sp. YIM S09857]|uniref:sensor histidine kinase n=1 Tax=Yinghuangia sp. YIM S09857 TaxID=3436929 RepID=UPI003F5378EF
MVRVGSPPESQRPTAPAGPLWTGPVWLIPVAATVACSAVAVALVDGTARPAVAVCLAVATVAVALVTAESARRGSRIAAHQARHAAATGDLRARHQAEIAALRRGIAAQESAMLRLTGEQLPKAILRVQQGESAGEVLDGLVRAQVDAPEVSPEFAAARLAVLRSVAEAVEAEEGLRDSAQRAFVNIARRVQAIVHQQATDLREMEERHGAQPDVFGDLLRLDHGTALIGRLADSIAVLGGARPGRQWQNNVPLYSVLRGAVSRITDYPRVELMAVTEVAVVGMSVEPLIHALAELLDNATRYSPPQTVVRVSASEVQSGVAVEIEDGGIGLAEEARRRVERLLEEASAGLDLADLGESPRLGLAVVGRLAQEHGFRVALRPSAYGGVRAILVIPKELITTAPVSVVSGAAPGLDALPAARTRKSSGPARGSAARDDRGSGAHRVGRGSGSHRGSAEHGFGDGRFDQGRLDGTGSGARGRGPDESDDAVGRTANGLPQRRRRLPATPPRIGPPQAAPVRPDAPAPPPAEAAAEQPQEPGLWLAAFQSAVSGESPAPGGRDESLDEGDR